MTAIAIVPRSTTTITIYTARATGRIVLQTQMGGMNAWVEGPVPQGGDWTNPPRTKKKFLPTLMINRWKQGLNLIAPFLTGAIRKLETTPQEELTGVNVTIQVSDAGRTETEQVTVKLRRDGVEILEELLTTVFAMHGKFRR